MNNFAQKEFNTIVFGACILSANAGFINVVTLAGVFSVTVSHVTGNVSRVAISIFQGDLTTAALVTSILFSFMFGAFISGYMVGDHKFVLGRSYGYALLLESVMLFMSYISLKGELIVGEWCAAFACGLQNAMATSYSGLVVRTTHMTGIATDIGNILGQACRQDSHAEVWRLYVHVPIMISYMVGGVFGQLAYYFLHEQSLLFPCFLTGITAVTYLSLPFIQAATQAHQEKQNILKEQGRKHSNMEIRLVGDPRKVGGGLILTDKQTVLKGTSNDLEIREFFGDVNNSLDELDMERGKGKPKATQGDTMIEKEEKANQFTSVGGVKYTGVYQEEGSTEVLTANHPMQ
ncbi:DUF1275-domain-containing protein [Rhizoclosmatium globosum]|uniref:DUF1275-domain-containing protein n=1 Tax=Rhizoclosmatium globosum TaxID=329046 RepID=A0A1Y2CNH0_9FUNG|nr:DUF1275-domain-containing protein [Rhizoclosmatium globosum]|eukprot:ORY48517.1 DUF1275-domain-containing protein [Rhizoclosmatium globosum]